MAEAAKLPCPRSTGYAVGAEIGFPALDPELQKMPTNADPAFKPFWGRWEGDDEDGTYMILETVDVRAESIFLRIGISTVLEVVVASLAFQEMFLFSSMAVARGSTTSSSRAIPTCSW